MMPSRSEPTNMYKLFRACCPAGAAISRPQLFYCLPGVGHDIRQRRVGAAAGWYAGP